MTRYRQSMFPWADMTGMAFQSTMLAIEAQQVIAMRLTKMALGGPDVHSEAELMVSEKLQAMVEGGQMMMTAAFGGTSHQAPAKVVRMYRKKVRANRKRLSA